MLSRKELLAQAILSQHESELNQARKAAIETHRDEEAKELEKLKQALEMGSTLRLQQMRDSLRSQQEAALQDMEQQSQVALNRELDRIRQEHDIAAAADMRTLRARLIEYAIFTFSNIRDWIVPLFDTWF